MLITPHVQSSPPLEWFHSPPAKITFHSVGILDSWVAPIYSSFWPYLGRSAKHPCGLLVQHSIVADLNTQIILNSLFPILSQRLQLQRHIKRINRVYCYVLYQSGNPASEGPLSLKAGGGVGGGVLPRSPGRCQPPPSHVQLPGRFPGALLPVSALDQLPSVSARPCSAVLDSRPRGCCRRARTGHAGGEMPELRSVV